MRLKVFGSLLTLALVACAFLSAGSASATVFCKKNENPCSSGSMYSLGSEWKFKLVSGTNVVVKGSSFEVKCSASEFGGKLEAQGALIPAKSQITTHSISGCTEVKPGCVGTTTLTPAEPWEMQFLSKSSGGEAEEALWRRAHLILSAPCTNSLSRCVYAAFNQKVYEKEGQAAAYEKGSVIWHVTGGSQATKMTGFLGEVEGGVGCPPSIEIEGSYEITTPVPLYLI